MTDTVKIVGLEVANRCLQLKCHPEDVALLKNGAEQLNDKINEIKATGQFVGQDRIILMAALSLTHALKLQQQHSQHVIDELEQKISSLAHKIAVVLPET